VVGCCKCGDELLGSGATELISPTIDNHLWTIHNPCVNRMQLMGNVAHCLSCNHPYNLYMAMAAMSLAQTAAQSEAQNLLACS
jgi:hypothetical protein